MVRIKRFLGSFYFRILLIFLATVLLLILVVSGTFRWIVKDGRDSMRPIAINYVKYIVHDIGIPPNLDRAMEITQQMPVRIVIRGPGIDWQSEPDIIPDTERPEWLNLTEPLLVHERKMKFAIFPKDQYRFYVAWQFRFVKHKDRFKSFIGLAIMLAIFWGSYLATQRLLRPVREVSAAAKKIQAGDLDFRVKKEYPGELGDLCENVNNMADSLKAMLEAKRQMLLAISHEIRSPITRAKVNSEFIDNEKIRKRISSDLDEMESLVGALIESERLNQPHVALNRESVDMNVVIMKVCSRWPDKQIQLSLPERPATTYVDATRFELMLRNVVGNAVRYGKDKPVDVALHASKDTWYLSIKDHGQGISATHLQHIAEPFYRPDDSRQRQTGGVGLGLYLAKRIIEAHGGRMTISSCTATDVSGTTVVFAWQSSS